MGDEASGTRRRVERVVTKLRSGPPGQRSYPLTLSVGIAWLDPGSGCSVEGLMRRADDDMYSDKQRRARLARVLVVDDDASLRDLARFSLGDRFDIVPADTGVAAIDSASEQVPDLILLDLTLPDMPGTEVLRGLRALPGGNCVPIIVITGATERDVELECLQLGVNDFIVKPFDLAVLEARMNNVLNRSPRPPRPPSL